MNESKIKVGDVGSGQVNGHPPADWKLLGKLNGAWWLEHVKPESQSTAFKDQFVAWEDVERIMGKKSDQPKV